YYTIFLAVFQWFVRYCLNYIMGNPPFVGYSLQDKAQKADILSIYVDKTGKPYKAAGKIDYVAGWYFKAAQIMQDTSIRAAFVSTNSITQGEQVAAIWKPLYERFNIHIDFAHRTFRWDSEATLMAHVHCVIVGFSVAPNSKERLLFDNDTIKKAENINAYLVETEDVFVESRKKPLCDVPEMTTGNRPADGGNLIIEAEDYEEFVRKEPNAVKYIKKFMGSVEYINNKDRYCLWLVNISPAELRKMPEVMKRVELCRQDRLSSPDKGRQKLAETPSVFRETQNPEQYVIMPKVSSERRRYIPCGFMNGNVIPSDLVFIIPNATLYHFGVLTSNVHMNWMRAVAGRLEMRYRYSKDIVYNNFPWCNPTPEQKARIEKTAQAILDARVKYPDCSLADLYDDLTMPPELRKAHQENDRAVMAAYGFNIKITESECVAELMRMYREMTE
ncbi:MAG: class I SAM-dependent DNA methyltransferase, partial [Oscillospiraceae bacterium]|nr:class I SAM-dependent DNA methyltransferase [Oscillospiraceae bacterium]